MNLNSMYSVSETGRQVDGYFFRIHLNYEPQIYSGHFPQFPICPGMLLIWIVRHCIKSVTNSNVSWEEINKCKFHHPCYPEDDLFLVLGIEGYDALNKHGQVTAKMSKGEQLILSMQALSLITQ